MKNIIPLAAGVSGKGGEPILAGAIHHWSASNWTEAAGNVTAVQDMAGTANLAPNGAASLAKGALGGTKGRFGWTTVAGSALMRSSAVAATTYNEWTVVCVCKPTNLSCVIGWGVGNGITFGAPGSIIIDLALFPQDNTPGGLVVIGTPIVFAASCRTDGGGANGRLRIATKAGIQESYDGAGISTPNVTNDFDAGGINGIAVGGQVMSAFTFSNAYNSDAALVSACNRYGAFWGV